ncbi:MAG: hypothetical protein ACRCV3_05005 [Desulfovibrionaceae bacterium]
MKANISELPLPQTRILVKDIKSVSRGETVLRLVPQKYVHNFLLFDQDSISEESESLSLRQREVIVVRANYIFQ